MKKIIYATSGTAYQWLYWKITDDRAKIASLSTPGVEESIYVTSVTFFVHLRLSFPYIPIFTVVLLF